MRLLVLLVLEYDNVLRKYLQYIATVILGSMTYQTDESSRDDKGSAGKTDQAELPGEGSTKNQTNNQGRSTLKDTIKTISGNITGVLIRDSRSQSYTSQTMHLLWVIAHAGRQLTGLHRLSTARNIEKKVLIAYTVLIPVEEFNWTQISVFSSNAGSQ